MIAIFPQIAKLVAKGDIENLVCMVRKYYGGPDAYAPVLDVERLLAHAGIPTQTSPQVALGALVAEDRNGRFMANVIIHPKIVNPVERNLLLAHLLGHFLLQVQPEIAQARGRSHGYKELVSPLSRFHAGIRLIDEIDWCDQEDRQADLFALALLLPMGMIKRAFSSLQSMEKIAAFFGSLPHLVQLRLGQLQMVENASAFGKAQAEPCIVPSNSKQVPEILGEVLDKPISSVASPLTSPAEKNLASMESEAAILRGQRLIAGQRYRSQPAEATSSEDSAPKVKTSQPLEGGLKRLREIAKRLDASVKI